MPLPPPLHETMTRRPVMGMINLSPSPIHTELLCALGFDLLWLDLEHGCHSVAEAGAAMTTAFGRGVTPVVRVPEVADWAVKWVLDQGARGIAAGDLVLPLPAGRTPGLLPRPGGSALGSAGAGVC